MGTNAYDMTQAQYVSTIGRSSVTHALVEGWSYESRKTLCGRSGGNVEHFQSGALQEVTCKACRKVMERETARKNTDELLAASDARLTAAGVEHPQTIMTNAEVAEYDRAQRVAHPPVWPNYIDNPRADESDVLEQLGLSHMIKAQSDALAQGVRVSEMPSAPDFNAPGAGECYYGCGRPVVAVFVDYVGRTEGLCAADRERVEGQTYSLPTPTLGEAESATESVSEVSSTLALVRAIQNEETPIVGVIQGRSGVTGRTHYHSPACADVKREMERYGQTSADVERFTVASVREILEFNYADIASDQYPSNSLEWWMSIFENAAMDEYCGIQVMPCLSRLPLGETEFGPIIKVGGNYRIDEATVSVERDDSARKFPCVKVGGVVIHKGECAQALGVNGACCSLEDSTHAFNTCTVAECPECAETLYTLCKSQHPDNTECPACNAYEKYGYRVMYQGVGAFQDSDSDGGFVETMVTKEYQLRVIVDERSGATVDLGWVTLEINSAQQNDNSAICEAYGKAHGSGKPRHGWQSIIIVSGSRSL